MKGGRVLVLVVLCWMLLGALRVIQKRGLEWPDLVILLCTLVVGAVVIGKWMPERLRKPWPEHRLLWIVQFCWIVLLVGGIGFSSWRSPEPHAPSSVENFSASQKAPAAQGDRITMTEGAVGCVWEVQEKVRDYAVAKDPEAIKSLWIAGALTGKCETFSKGDQVIVMERSVWHNMTRIKKVGAIGDYWIAGQPE